MSSINTITLSGNLTRDPELKEVGESHVCNFSIAVNDYVKKENVTYFFDCAVWGHTAKYLANYGAKGRRVMVQGKLQKRSYENDEGQTIWRTDILVRELDLPKGDIAPPSGDGADGVLQLQAVGDDKLPF